MGNWSFPPVLYDTKVWRIIFSPQFKKISYNFVKIVLCKFLLSYQECYWSKDKKKGWVKFPSFLLILASIAQSLSAPPDSKTLGLQTQWDKFISQFILNFKKYLAPLCCWMEVWNIMWPKYFWSHILLISDYQKSFDSIVLFLLDLWNHSIFEVLFDFWIFKKYLTLLC